VAGYSENWGGPVMLEFAFYVNILLFALGIALVFVLISKQKEQPRLVRAILLAYFLVVLQYNFERLRFTGEYLLLGTAAIALFAWVRQPIPSSEEAS
jgi:hypothetical protein